MELQSLVYYNNPRLSTNFEDKIFSTGTPLLSNMINGTIQLSSGEFIKEKEKEKNRYYIIEPALQDITLFTISLSA